MTVFQNPHALEIAYVFVQIAALVALMTIIYKVVEVSTENEKQERNKKWHEDKD